MSSSAPPEKTSLEPKLARFLGWFSLSLGIPQIARPDLVNRAIGVRDDAKSRFWQRVVGVREMAAGAGILATQPRPVPVLWARVAGDIKDLTLLGTAWRTKRESTSRLAAAAGSVVVVTALDVFTAVRMSRGTKRTPEEEMSMEAKAAITVRAPLGEVFLAWENFENFPRFMNHLESVERTGDRRSRWRANAVAGRSVEWEAEVITLTPNELIEWRSVAGSGVDNSGVVRFRPAPGNQGTEIHVYIQYDAPGGKLGEMIAKLTGDDATSKAKDDLRRFKQLIETGEIVRSEATPEGTAARGFLKQRPAQPLPEREPVGRGGSV